MSVDMRTVCLMGFFINTFCLLFISLLWQQNRKRFAGTTFFVVDFAFQTIAFILIVLRGYIPDWVSVVFSNVMVFGGTVAGYMGLLCFTHKKSKQIFNYVLLVAITFIHSYFTFVEPNLGLRNLNISLGLLLVFFQCFWLMWYRVEPKMRLLTNDVGIVFGIYCMICILRIGHFLVGTNTTNVFFHSHTFDTLILATHFLLLIPLTFSIVLMFNKRLLMDIRAHEEKYSVAFRCSPNAITISRIADGLIIEANNGFVQISGYALAEIIGKSTLDLHLWAQEEDRTQVVNDLIQKKTVYNRELQFRKKSGELITGLFSADTISIGDEIYVLSSISDITERKQVEDILKSRETFLEELLMHLPMGILIVDPVTRHLELVNHIAAKLHGSLPEKLLGLRCHSLVCPAIEGACPICDLNQSVDRSDRILLCADGSHLPILKTVIKINIGGHEKLLESFFDITELKKAEMALKESETRFLNVIYASSDAILLIGKNTFVDCNEVTARMLGYATREEFIQTHPSTLSPPKQPDGRDSLEKAEEMMKMAFENGFHRFEWIHRKANGEDFPVEVSLTPIVLESRHMLYCVWRDLTEYKELQSKLVESEKQLRTIADVAQDGIIMINPQGSISFANPAASRIFGYDRTYLTGKNLHLLLAPERYHAAHQYAFTHFVKTGCGAAINKTTELAARKNDGTEISIELSLAGLEQPDGWYAIGILRDITERKRLDAHLIQSEKLAGIGQLAAGVAHEINNPVGFVTSNTENLVKYFTSLKKIIGLYRSGAQIDEIKAQERALKIDFILKDVEVLISENRDGLARVAAIVKNLKDFAHIDQKGQTSAVDINASLQSALVLARNEIKYHADVRACFGEIPMVYCNAGEINQVFLNILINAAQAIRDQQRQNNGIIEVRTTTQGDTVICTISDDGPGVPEKYVNQIFNPFFTTKEIGKGTGLGLSISYDIIVNKHSGKLGIARSALGGAEFTIELPVKRDCNNEC